MKAIKIPSALVCAALGFFYCLQSKASPLSDLSSPSQKTREAAAKVLRNTYIAPPRTNWDALVNALKLGTPQAIIEAQLRSSNLVSGGGLGSGNTDTKTYRLDDLWFLNCSFTNSTLSVSNSGLSHVRLTESLRDVWVEPPPDYTGDWTTYYVNGQPCHRGFYKNGRPDGEGFGYYPDGSKSTVLHWANGFPNGEELSYYKSGKIKSKGNYKAGHQVGRWTWYKEDGSIESEKDYGSG